MSKLKRRSYRGVSKFGFGVGAVAGLMLWGGVTQAASASLIGRDADELAGVQIPLDESCAALQADGANKLLVLSPESQPDQAILLGLGNGTVLWEQSVPWQDDRGGFNSVKTWGSCDERELTLYSQVPYWAATFIQTFSWTGQELRFVSHDFADASAEILEATIVVVESQRALPTAPVGLESPFEGLMYPQNYIHGDSMGAAIARGHAVALAQYEAGETEVAAKILREMFELTRSLNALVGRSDEAPGLSDLERWLSTWQQLGIEPVDYIGALNDYGFFLQELGEHVEASAVFVQVLEREPERTVAYLNLADSLWTLNRPSAARSVYQTYVQQMEQKGWQGQIPERVIQRR